MDKQKVRFAISWALDISCIKDSENFEVTYRKGLGYDLEVVADYVDESCFCSRGITKEDALRISKCLTMLGYTVNMPNSLKE